MLAACRRRSSGRDGREASISANLATAFDS
jgi:hypothetical protein